MKRAFLLAFLALAAACANKQDPNAAVRKAIMDHLSSRPGLDFSKMDVEVTKVSVNGDRAEADVSFKVKGGGGPGGSMDMHYSLTRAGDAWKVDTSATAGAH